MDKNSNKMSQNNLQVLAQSKQPRLLKRQLKTSQKKTYEATFNDGEEVDDHIEMLKMPAAEILEGLTEEKGFDDYVEDTAAN